MDMANLGRSGLKVSRICLGMMTYGSSRWQPWVLDEDSARPIVRRAAEAGINFYDTANVYSAGESERVTGRLLKEIYGDRDDYVVATKVFNDVAGRDLRRPNHCGLSRKHVMSAIDASLTRLGLDHVDLYQIHRWDPHTPIAETMEALHDVVKAGKARYIGASSMYAWQFLSAQQVARERGFTQFVSMQNHYNLAYREEEREMNPLCRELGVGLIPWSPLARGFLAGNRRRDGEREAQRGGDTIRSRTDRFAQRFYYDDADFAVVAALTRLAAARGESNARLAYAWLLHKGVVAPIVGASRVEQLEDAIAAVTTTLSGAEIEVLEAPYRPHPILGHE